MSAKVAAITGAYKGLGAALAKALAKKGYKLVIGGRDKQELEKFSMEIRKLTDAVSVVMDVRKKRDCERFVQVATKAFGRLDLLINNAGVWKLTPIEEITEDALQEMFETNVFGPIYCAQAAVTIMKKQGHGHILNIGSTAAVTYKNNHIAYSPSKAALVNFTGCLHTELEGTGIRVSVFSPGGMKTELFRTKSAWVQPDFMDPAFVAEKVMEHIEHPSEEWHIILRRPK